ncbi:ATP-binding protein [Streptomyces atratus]|uniref:AAA domain-containing protein n=1 Tax=Streptomyces atratus TaxID=1893 RepID=A0A1K2F8X2_STRAR|nr:ATP-binding protein [Streptomyces atratus]SFY43469.1 AAA domain-containing protein [Streptomyces atratus]
MYVSRVYIENIKSFHGLRAVDLTLTRPDGSHAGWTVLAGRNGAGKTTLLRALALTLSGPASARGLVQNFENWVTWEWEGFGTAQAEVVTDPAFDEFTTSGYTQDRFWTRLKWTEHAESAGGRRSPQPALTEIRDDARPEGDSPAWQGPWADNPVGWFCAAYGPFRRMAGGSGEVQRLMLASGPVARQVSLFHGDASLAEGVAWLIEQHLRALEGREGAAELKAAALSVLGDGLLPDGYRVEEVDSEGLWVTRDGHRYPLREMSDGFRTVAALVVDLLKQIHDTFGDEVFGGSGDGPSRLKVPGVVIIDEIDAHLHVSWQRRIGPWLTSHFPNIQFIVTTHSPYICQAADPGGLIRLPGVDEDTAPEVVPEELYERVVYGSGDDAVLSELFGLDTPYSVRAEHARAEFGALESKVYDGDTSPDTVARYKALKGLLASSPAARVVETSARLHRIAEEIRNGEEGEAE